jgi:hypothetical protein
MMEQMVKGESSHCHCYSYADDCVLKQLQPPARTGRNSKLGMLTMKEQSELIVQFQTSKRWHEWFKN